MRAALSALRERFGDVLASPVYRTAAVGYEGAEFLNLAAIVTVDLDPFALNTWLHALEEAHGRDRSGARFRDRPLDIDIVFYDDRVVDGADHLQIPRDELRHAFVLKPLADIAPEFADPRSGRTLRELWQSHPDHAASFDVVTL